MSPVLAAPGPARLLAAARQRGLRAIFGREAVLAPLVAVAFAILMTWPTARHPATTIPGDIYDPLLVAWSIAWGGHALLHQPLSLWQSNAFYPEPDSYAFSDSLFGYFPLALFGSGPEAAVVRYNVVYILIATLAFLGAYALARQLGARWPGALVAGAAFAYAPWRLVQAGHLHVLSTGGLALALAALLHGHGYSFRDGYRPERVRPGWAVAGWVAACWQLLIGFGVGLPFAYVLVLVGIVAVVGWLLAGRPAVPRKLLAVDVGGTIAFAVTGLLMAQPYLRVVEKHPYARRTEADLAFFSPPLRGFLTAPAESWLWGESHEVARAKLPFAPEMTMLPGVAVLALAVAGLVLSSWTVRQRIALFAATVVSVVFAMGTQFFGGHVTYLLLYRYLPGWDAIRTPGRLVIYTTLGLGLLAAGFITAVGDALAARRGAAAPEAKTPADKPRQKSADTAAVEPAPRWPVWVTAVLVVPGLLVLLEGTNKTPHPTVPTQPAALHGVAGPVLVLPSDPLSDQSVMLWSTDGFPKIVNGGSGFYPRSTEQVRATSASFPDGPSVDYLRNLGVRTVVVLRDRVGNTPWAQAADRPVDGLPLKRTEVDQAVVFSLEPR